MKTERFTIGGSRWALAVAACTALAGVEGIHGAELSAPAVRERWKYPAGSIDNRGETRINGWVGPWKSDGYEVISGAAVGNGRAERTMVYTVDFAHDDEWYFLITIKRTGWSRSGTADHASFQLFNRDRDPSISATPLHIGIASNDVFEIGIGAQQREFFGDAKKDGPHTIVARLTTRKDGSDVISAWVVDSAKLPATLPAKPDAEARLDYGGKSNGFALSSAKTDGFKVTFGTIAIANDYASLRRLDAPPTTMPHNYRPLPRLKVSPEARRPLSTHWSSISVIPWAADGRPRILEMSNHGWEVQPRHIFTPDPAAPGELPRFRAAPFDGLPHGKYQAIPTGRPGEFDLLNRTSLEYRAWKGRDANGPTFADPYTVQTAAAMGGAHFVDDIDGDGVPDAVISRLLVPWTEYWPEGKGPWSLPRRDILGPHRDTSVTEGFRGYDVAGGWLGEPITHGLFWAKGRRDAAGRLAFDAPVPMFYGRDDFPARWRNYTQNAVPAIIERDGVRYVVWFSAVDQALAMPVIGIVDGRMTLGRAQPLLREGEDVRLMHRVDVHAVIDMNGDGKTELVVGSGSSARATVLAGDRIGDWSVLGQLEELGGTVSVDTLGVPARADWTGDGIPDLIIGDGNGLLSLWPGTADPLTYDGAKHFSDAEGQTIFLRGPRNIQGPQEISWGYSCVDVGDWDGDGQLDLVTNDNTATLQLFRRADPADPMRLRATSFLDAAGNKLPVAWRARPAIVPGNHGIAGDNRPVLLYIDTEQQAVFGIPSAAGSTTIERVVPLASRDGKPIVLAGFGGASGRTDFQIVDWDEDGLWDVLFTARPVNMPVFVTPEERRINDHLGTSANFVLKNVGTAARPVFEAPRRIVWADGGFIRVETHALSACMADLDGDGNADDLIMADGPGNLVYVLRDQVKLR